MIDPHSPLELDNGVPVELIEVDRYGRTKVRLPEGQPYRRDGEIPPLRREGWYELSSGVWIGGDPESHYYLVNATDSKATEMENWS